MKTLLIIGSENYSGRLSCGSLVRIQQGVQNKQSDEIESNLKMMVIAVRKKKVSENLEKQNIFVIFVK